MTRTTFLRHSESYNGKPAPQNYVVYTMRNAGCRNVETFYITGINNVKSFLIDGNYYSWEVKDDSGRIVDPKFMYGG